MILYAHITLYAIRVSYYVRYIYVYADGMRDEHVNRFRGGGGGGDDGAGGIDIVVLLSLLYYCYMTCSLFYGAEEEGR